MTIKDVGQGIHFVQEDNPEGIAEAILNWANEFSLV